MQMLEVDGETSDDNIPGSSEWPIWEFSSWPFQGWKRDLHLGYQRVTWKKLVCINILYKKYTINNPTPHVYPWNL